MPLVTDFQNDAIFLISGQGYIVEALPSVIEKLEARGLKPVTVSELVNESLETNKK